jgi:hypothetical protein
MVQPTRWTMIITSTNRKRPKDTPVYMIIRSHITMKIPLTAIIVIPAFTPPRN